MVLPWTQLTDYTLKDAGSLDGLDLSGLIFGSGSLPDRELYWTWYNPFYAYDDRWALRHEDWKIVFYGRGEPTGLNAWQLFNLKDDPKEHFNVARQFPEKLSELHARYLRQREKDSKSFFQKDLNK